MVNNQEEIDALIMLYLKGEANPEQAMALEDWKQASEENSALFTSMEKAYQLSHGLDGTFQVNPVKAWEKLDEQLVDGYPENMQRRNKKAYYMAASILILIGIGLWLNNMITKPKSIDNGQIVNVLDTTKEVLETHSLLESFTLADQTSIELEKESKITIAHHFNEKNRTVHLEGSATFRVIHNDKKPFVVHVNELKITDLGTVFKVKSSKDTIKVAVYEGKVELSMNNQIVEMEEGDSAFYLVKNKVIQQYKKERARKNKVFEFDGTKLSEVTSILSEFYQQDIVIKNQEIEDCPVSVTFKNEELATILDIIKELLDIEVVKTKNAIEIYGKECI